jgi:hypothetical protein
MTAERQNLVVVLLTVMLGRLFLRDSCASSRPSTLLPRSEWLATLVDGGGKDLAPGEQLVACFRPFLEYRAASDLSPKTIQKQVGNMWALVREATKNKAIQKSRILLVVQPNQKQTK